ncbi:MAG: hypothetical protein IJR45_08100 [Firmicutes bacterium]|nr:hypothetical protein [Bacillota bacterium]
MEEAKMPTGRKLNIISAALLAFNMVFVSALYNYDVLELKTASHITWLLVDSVLHLPFFCIPVLLAALVSNFLQKKPLDLAFSAAEFVLVVLACCRIAVLAR